MVDLCILLTHILSESVSVLKHLIPTPLEILVKPKHADHLDAPEIPSESPIFQELTESLIFKMLWLLDQFHVELMPPTGVSITLVSSPTV